MPIDGLISGLDTNEIIAKLMELEAKPRIQMANRRDQASSALDSLKTIDIKLGAVSLAANALSRPSGWTMRSATSSNTGAATASASLGAAPTNLSFTVDSLARAHGLATGAAVGATTTVIASGGSITVDVGGVATVVPVGGGTLDEVAAAINGAGLKLRASTVNTGNGDRLQVDATTTGAATEFTLAGLDPVAGGTVVTTEAADARLTLGTGPGAYSVTSSTNVFTGVTPGLTIVAKSISTGPVEVTVASDATAIADRVSALVDAVNAALTEISTQTAYDPATKKASTLTGDAGVRRISQTLVRAVTDAVSQSGLGSAGLAGVSMDRSGKITFDRDTFTAKYAEDPAAVERLFVQGGTTSTPELAFVSGTDRTAAGQAAVEITALPTAATITSDPLTFPPAAPTTITFRRGGITASYEVQVTDSAADAVQGLQSALDAAEMGITISESGGALTALADAEGDAASFEVAWDGSTYFATFGTDIAGTIDGEPATGKGRSLVATAPPFTGLEVAYRGLALGPAGTVDYGPGLAQRLLVAVADARAASGGTLTSSTATRQGRIDLLTRSLEAYDRRLVSREAQLRKQYAALEVALGKLQSSGNWLTGQLSSLQANSSR